MELCYLILTPIIVMLPIGGTSDGEGGGVRSSLRSRRGRVGLRLYLLIGRWPKRLLFAFFISSSLGVNLDTSRQRDNQRWCPVPVEVPGATMMAISMHVGVPVNRAFFRIWDFRLGTIEGRRYKHALTRRLDFVETNVYIKLHLTHEDTALSVDDVWRKEKKIQN